MKNLSIKGVFAAAALLSATAAHSFPLIFQGSSDPTAAVPDSPAVARAKWEAELSSFIIDEISGVATGTAAPFTTTAGVTYTETNTSDIDIEAFNFAGGGGGSIAGDRNSESFIQFNAEFPSFVNAVAFDVLDNDGGTMDLFLEDAFTGAITQFSLQSTPGSGDIEFFGVVFDTSTFITSLTVSGTDPGGLTNWDNFSFGVGENVIFNPNTPVPAPGVLFLIGIGLAGATVARKRSA